jgi:mycothiol system anti-sigma-R factor
MAGKDCDDALHELYSFIDGELTDQTRARIRQHLDDCPPCFERYDFEAELKAVISRKCQERVPDGLRDRIVAALRGEDPAV